MVDACNQCLRDKPETGCYNESDGGDDMLDFIAIGNKIRDLRTAHRYQQDQIAEKLYVTRQAVSRWELGQTLPSVDNLIELGRLFGTSFEELLCLDEVVKVDETDIFRGHDRNFIVRKIVDGTLKVNLPDVFYRFSNTERMMVLKAVRYGVFVTDLHRLWPKLMPEEQRYLNKKEKKR